jgi:hypothetical protein
MGEARRKLMLATRIVKFDFTLPKLVMVRADREGLGGGSRAVAAGVKILLNQLVQAKHKDGVDRQVGKAWAAWQEYILEESEAGEPVDVVEMPLSQVEWLARIAKDETVKVRPEFAQWREALIDYLDELMAEGPEEQQPA